MNRNTLPGYIDHDGSLWHLRFEGDTLVVRIVNSPTGTPRLFTHQPAGNVVVIKPETEA